MTAVLRGVRILEVAEHTFVPAASAALADLGAEVIKVEHVERGDAMRGLASTGVITNVGNVHALLEHSNRGKRSIGLDLTSEDGLAVLHKLIAISDVFLTNKLPGVRAKLHIDVADVRAHNENIIYVRGTGQGNFGPDADKGSYDSLAFWARAGVAVGCTPQEFPGVIGPPGPGFGDSIGAMTIAGGIMGALFHRERTGDATIVDVSLLGTGMWAMGQAIALSALHGTPWTPPAAGQGMRNPLTGNYKTADDRTLAFTCLQAGKYWGELCHLIGHPELATDERFSQHAALLQNGSVAVEILKGVFLTHTLEEWRSILDPFTGQWAVVQNTVELANDPQAVANGYLQDCTTSDGTPFRLVAVPVQYDEQPAPAHRSPEFNEHGDDILQEIGLDWDAIIDLKVRGVVA